MLTPLTGLFLSLLTHVQSLPMLLRMLWYTVVAYIVGESPMQG